MYVEIFLEIYFVILRGVAGGVWIDGIIMLQINCFTWEIWQEICIIGKFKETYNAWF